MTFSNFMKSGEPWTLIVWILACAGIATLTYLLLVGIDKIIERFK